MENKFKIIEQTHTPIDAMHIRTIVRYHSHDAVTIDEIASYIGYSTYAYRVFNSSITDYDDVHVAEWTRYNHCE